MNADMESLIYYLTQHHPPTDDQIVERVNRIRKTDQRVYGSYAVEMALEAAFALGLKAADQAEHLDSRTLLLLAKREVG